VLLPPLHKQLQVRQRLEHCLGGAPEAIVPWGPGLGGFQWHVRTLPHVSVELELRRCTGSVPFRTRCRCARDLHLFIARVKIYQAIQLAAWPGEEARITITLPALQFPAIRSRSIAEPATTSAQGSSDIECKHAALVNFERQQGAG
jgi:hypothetical protein